MTAPRLTPAIALLLLVQATTGTAQRLQYVATAEQLGPVSFRDPLGVLSPDGATLAWSVQHHLYLRAVGGGPIRELATEGGLILQLAWLSGGRALAVEHRFATPHWWRYDLETGSHAPLFGAAAAGPNPDSLRQLAWSADGGGMAGIRDTPGGTELWLFRSGRPPALLIPAGPARLSFPAFAPDGHLACLSRSGSRQVLRDPCVAGPAPGGAVAAYGPIAFAPSGDTLYYAAPNPQGFVDLWARPRTSPPLRLTGFTRDSYAPSVARDGSLLFKLQLYRTRVGVVPATGGAVALLTGFQSETPSWDPTGRWIGITYGTWRRVIDDFAYPDIAQDIGIVSAAPLSPAAAVTQVVDRSPSEDQSLHWSPNGRWIAYHSHKDLGDDVYLVPADRSRPARRITSFGRGFETGWPRWSPDGKWLAFDADSRGADRKSVIYVMGVDQETGTVTAPEREVALEGFAGEAVHAEWLPDSRGFAILGDETAGRQVILLASRDGGPVRVLHRWSSEHLFSGLAVSPDGKDVAFIAPAGGWFQLFRMPLAGGNPVQLTADPSNKTQPAWSPDGGRIALTVWEYAVQFWQLRR